MNDKPRRCIGLEHALAAAALLLSSGTALAQQSAGTSSQGSDVPDEGDKAVDRGGLSSRGGEALQSRRTFQETIGTPIYTPIGTAIYTPVQRPPESDRPQG